LITGLRPIEIITLLLSLSRRASGTYSHEREGESVVFANGPHYFVMSQICLSRDCHVVLRRKDILATEVFYFGGLYSPTGSPGGRQGYGGQVINLTLQNGAFFFSFVLSFDGKK
jgi:hypothetical protein